MSERQGVRTPKGSSTTKARQTEVCRFARRAKARPSDREFLFIRQDDKTTPNRLDFAKVQLYNIKSGTKIAESSTISVQCNIENILVMNNKVLIICQDFHPHFYAIIADKLQEIPVQTAESILRLSYLCNSQCLALIEFYSETGWEQHNDVVINPQMLDVSTPLHIELKKRYNNGSIKVINFDATSIAKLLTKYQKTRTGITYITI